MYKGFSRRLLVSYPLAWRLHIFHGLGIALCVAILQFCVFEALQWRNEWGLSSYGRLPILLSPLAWLVWTSLRFKYPAPSLPIRMIARYAWIDILGLLAFSLPGIWILGLESNLPGLAGRWATLAYYLAAWSYVILLQQFVRAQAQTRRIWSLLACIFRWDILLVDRRLRKIFAQYELHLSKNYPDLWAIRIHRRLMVAISIFVLTGTAIGIVKATVGYHEEQNFVLILVGIGCAYTALGAPGYQVAQAIALPVSHLFRPSWGYVFVDSMVSALGTVLVLLIPVWNILDISDWWWPLLALSLVIPITFSTVQLLIDKSTAIAVPFVMFFLYNFIGIAVVWIVAVAACAIAAILRLMPTRLAFRRRIGLARFVVAAVPSCILFIGIKRFRFDDEWLIFIPSSLGFAMVLYWVALPMIRAGRYWPESSGLIPERFRRKRT